MNQLKLDVKGGWHCCNNPDICIQEPVLTGADKDALHPYNHLILTIGCNNCHCGERADFVGTANLERVLDF